MSEAEGLGKPPTEIILGLTIGEWPIQTFTLEVHAITWVGMDPKRRRV